MSRSAVFGRRRYQVSGYDATSPREPSGNKNCGAGMKDPAMRLRNLVRDFHLAAGRNPGVVCVL
jgi:hypothetical protein